MEDTVHVDLRHDLRCARTHAKHAAGNMSLARNEPWIERHGEQQSNKIRRLGVLSQSSRRQQARQV